MGQIGLYLSYRTMERYNIASETTGVMHALIFYGIAILFLFLQVGVFLIICLLLVLLGF